MSLEKLPPEVQSLILLNLPLPALLTFALTSKRNYELARSTLTSLNLAVFPKKIHGVLAFLNTDDSTFLGENDNSTRYQIVLSILRSDDQRKGLSLGSRKDDTPQLAPPVQRKRSIQAQNDRLEHVVSSKILSKLMSLTIHIYSISSASLSMSMVQNLSELRHLTLNFSHPYIHDQVLSARYWETCPDITKEGSPAWNAFAGLGDEYAGILQLTSLQTLKLTRAAITSAQLSKWIAKSPELREIRLDMVAGVDRQFLEELVALQVTQHHRRSLEVLVIQRCPNLDLHAPADFKWIEQMLANGLRQLNLSGCDNICSNILRTFARERCFPLRGTLKLVCPDKISNEIEGEENLHPDSQNEKMIGMTNEGQAFPPGGHIEVDPAWE